VRTSSVEHEVLELAFEIGLHLEQFQAKHLGVGDERIRPAVPDLDRLVDEVVRPGRLSARSPSADLPGGETPPASDRAQQGLRNRLGGGSVRNVLRLRFDPQVS